MQKSMRRAVFVFDTICVYLPRLPLNSLIQDGISTVLICTSTLYQNSALALVVLASRGLQSISQSVPISPPLFEKPQKSRFWGFFVSGVWKGIRIGTLTPPRAFLRPAEL
jgi:hypothetical protein